MEKPLGTEGIGSIRKLTMAPDKGSTVLVLTLEMANPGSEAIAILGMLTNDVPVNISISSAQAAMDMGEPAQPPLENGAKP